MATNGQVIYNSDTEGYEVYIDGSWRQLNAPHDFSGSDTSTSIAGYGTFAFTINMDKKGYTKGYVHLLGGYSRGSFISFSNDGSFATVESTAYGANRDSAITATRASASFYWTQANYVYVYAITLNADGDTLTITFRNSSSLARTLYLRQARGRVW